MGSNQAINHQSEPHVGGGWTTVSGLRVRLAKRWARGKPLADYAAGRWKPISVRLKGPSDRDWKEHPVDAEVWAMELCLGSVDEFGGNPFRIETGRLSERAAVDAREGPVRIWFDTIVDLAEFVGVSGDLYGYERARSVADCRFPALSDWVRGNPKKVVAAEDIWDQLLGVVEWLVDHDPSQYYLREIDVVKVNLEFVEKNRRILDSMLGEVLAPDRIDRSFPLAQFERRYRFREGPHYIRLRNSAGVEGWPSGLSEMTIRVDELAELRLEATSIFLIENVDAYVSFPLPVGGIAVNGWAFNQGDLAMLADLAGHQIFFWGDTDARGYLILNLLRGLSNSVEPVLMGEAVLAAHASAVVGEGAIYRSEVKNLRTSELAMYTLVTGGDGGQPRRLPQEAIEFGWVKSEVAGLELEASVRTS